jgi:hypothetical protein
VLWKVGVSSENGIEGVLRWSLKSADGATVAEGEGTPKRIGALDSAQLEELYWVFEKPGKHTLTVEFGSARNAWTLWALDKPSFKDIGAWHVYDPARLFEGFKPTEGPNLIATRPSPDLTKAVEGGNAVLLFLVDELTQEAVFWRESAYEFFEDSLGIANEWERLFSVSGDRAIDVKALTTVLPGHWEPQILINRVDVRTYAEAPIMVKAGKVIATTLRPFGGLGVQPLGLSRNPSGQSLLASLMKLALG